MMKMWQRKRGNALKVPEPEESPVNDRRSGTLFAVTGNSMFQKMKKNSVRKISVRPNERSPSYDEPDAEPPSPGTIHDELMARRSGTTVHPSHTDRMSGTIDPGPMSLTIQPGPSDHAKRSSRGSPPVPTESGLVSHPSRSGAISPTESGLVPRQSLSNMCQSNPSGSNLRMLTEEDMEEENEIQIPKRLTFGISINHSVDTDSVATFVQEMLAEDLAPLDMITLLPSHREEEAEEVAHALRNCTRAVRPGGAIINLFGNKFGKNWDFVLDALASNTHFTMWSLSNCGIGGDTGLAVARALQKSPHVRSVHLRNNSFSSSALEQIAKAALQRDRLDRLVLVDEIALPFPPNVVSALVEVRTKFAEFDVQLGTGPQGRVLNSLVNMNSIINRNAQEAVQSLQSELLAAFTEGDMEQSQEIFECLKEEVVDPEHERLLGLFPGLIEKYALIGGFEHMATLPLDFDENKGQFARAAVQKESKEIRVRHLLAMSAYKANVLSDICSHVKNALDSLAQGATSAYLVNAVVDEFMKEYGLTDLASTLPAYKINPAEGASDIGGQYRQCGYCNGVPAFRRKCENPTEKEESLPEMYLYYNRVQSEWNINEVLNSNGRVLFLPEDEGCPPGEEQQVTRQGIVGRMCSLTKLPIIREQSESQMQSSPEVVVSENSLPVSSKHADDDSHVLPWQDPLSSKTVPLCFTPCECKTPVRDALATFLLRRVRDQEFRRLLSLGHELMYVKMGPRKTMERALQKDPDWLLDLNRCTLVFDSPVALVIGFHLLSRKVEELGGKICRLTNHFLQAGDFRRTGGLLKKEKGDFTAPPSIHINVLIDGWTFEVMFMLHDFMNAKDTLHKFYEIRRAREVNEILEPVFDPPQDLQI
eukprot:gnl/MRDRNA2_/MRDRNA2_115455_c0_seq1.p1 gnl/MRDRNA2_/MRDRNA2_115455_c0~~gnl/MRDRNA2_/MRDRNA2_115455_c0_seq1.p1  ORF type:complete len:876 (-),score=171.67 gnl/MRDRNA2_/MRDRNA2_115455_c0_seq1:152-2779(-)